MVSGFFIFRLNPTIELDLTCLYVMQMSMIRLPKFQSTLPDSADVAIIGGGAAGLMAAIFCARTNPDLTIVILDGARKLGAKILVAGGGRCNVTHYQVSAGDFAGTSQNSIKKVLLRFDVNQTVSFFEELGVKLKIEDTGKLFPVSDSAKDVLSALLNEVKKLGVNVYCHHRVKALENRLPVVQVCGDWGQLTVSKVIVATGGKSLPKSGSDGKGYDFCLHFGHSLTASIFPALVPLLLPEKHFLSEISGLSVNAKITVTNKNGKEFKAFTNAVLCTHFGLSGPAVLDISRYWLQMHKTSKDTRLMISWLVDISAEQLQEQILMPSQRRTVRNFLAEMLPVRLVDALCAYSSIQTTQKCSQLTKQQRKTLLAAIYQMDLPVVGDRGYRYAEVTAGGVPLTQIDLKTMCSRQNSNLYLCGEICDVDGRIGGFNFQWAWASGFVCGTAVAHSLQQTS